MHVDSMEGSLGHGLLTDIAIVIYVLLIRFFVLSRFFATVEDDDGDSAAEDEPLGQNIYAACPLPGPAFDWLLELTRRAQYPLNIEL